jgi:hypothetical protein
MAKKQKGRPRQWAQDMQARFPAGTFERIKRVLGEDEDRTDFVRTAVEHELKRRGLSTKPKR